MANAVYNRIPDLVKSFITQDNNGFELATVSLIRLLNQKDPKVSSELKQMLTDYRAGKKDIQEARSLSSVENALLMLTNSRKGINDLIVSNQIRENIVEIIQSYDRVDELRRVGLDPISKVLISGPSGTGKSTAAEVIASELKLPLYRVNTAQLLSSYLGDTSKNIDAIIQFVRTNRVVLLIDEFDSIGVGRDENNDIGEMRRIVNTLLQTLDAWENRGILIATTNRIDDIDDALLRRFDFDIRFKLPDKLQRFEIWQRYIGKYVDTEKLKKIALIVDQTSPAEIEIISHRALRQAILKHDNVSSMLVRYLGTFLRKSGMSKAIVVRNLKDIDKTLTLQQIARLVDSSTSSVSRYLKE
ncbi:hypothetical protein FD51_GL001002 [Lacticaseibacillus zeae DSM 20178 = KCTC 3804]|uniref:ATP-binding protein n=2 Tax=Lacticaseibacillus zeae TaxID=57037 RepID=A0A5R8LPT0_LACZE|nr:MULTISPECIES: ATP-binding protein [Lacticaseibacillus]KRK11713.1 hypothetical protein FD51_GL001002 [Lacticaseibacillus zeae DSM 20178 = KCTC 3804]MDE3283477.1 ATP-binding protein [Lacticaseibacillus casei]OLS10784.1 cell division protein FtsH [Lacticaseibacillus casei]QVI31631.1 ATP-binding protein [Lacticaseibacillus zeae]TLF39193.1 ATP-binding protein [Lacticaseibacillus zeae]